MPPEPPDRSAAPDAPEGGVTIPGYQPVELLGSAPSFGAWVRAIQVRMDRRVLLKVLRPGLPVAHEYFAREIAAVVRSDGEGVLRAIDEGTVRGYRYLVVDEADGIALTAEGIGGEEGARALALAALGLWRRILDGGEILLPIPAAAWRRLPAGAFVVADLGWLVPLGVALPQHPGLPRELVGRPARASDAIRGFESAGRGIAAAYGVAAAAPWRRAAQALASIPEEADADEVSAALRAAATALEPKRRSRTIPLAIAAVLVAAAAVWGTIEFIGRPHLGPGPVADDGVPVPAPPSEPGEVGEAGAPPPVDPEAEERREAEERAWASLDALLPDPAEPAPRGAGEGAATEPAEREPLPAEKVVLLARLSEQHAGTRAAAIARHEVEGERLDRVIALEEEWRRVHDGFSAEIAAGRLSAAEAVLEPYRARFRAEGGDGLLPDLAGGLARLRRTLVTRAATVRSTLEASVAAARRDRRYRKTAIELGRALPGLIAVDQEWAKRERVDLLETAERYEAVMRATDEAVSLAHESAAAGDFAAASTALAATPGEEEFPELAARRAEWEERVGRAGRLLAAIIAQLGREERAERPHPYRLADGERVRGRVVGLAGTGFDLKLEGLVETRRLRFLDLADDQRAELAGAGVPTDAETRLLLRHLLGDPDAVAGAAMLSPPPPWLEDARLRRERLANADLGRWLSEGRTAHAEGRAEAAREAARAIARAIPPRLWESERAEIEEWCRAHWRAIGPAAAFPGATVSWGADRSIALDYDFSREEAISSWVPTAAGRGRRRLAAKAMEVVGSVRLLAAGETDLFEGSLDVSASLVPREKNAPNLNLVLFARSDGEVGRGDLFGLGFRPPEGRVARIDGDTPIFLPANVCGPLDAAERGDGSRLPLARVEPRVPAGERVEVRLRSAPESLGFAWLGRFDETYPAAPARERRGTVEFVTYFSPVLVGELRIRGTLAAEWWGRWIGERVEEDLGSSS